MKRVGYIGIRLAALAGVLLASTTASSLAEDRSAEDRSQSRIARIRDYRAELVVGGERYADALAASEAFVARSGAMAVHAFDQTETLLGQGTIASELEEQVSNLDTLLVAVGGGGLVGGIAAWFDREVRVVAVEPEASPTMYRALAAGRPVDTEVGGIAADSLAPQRIGELVFPIAGPHRSRPAGQR
jgi:threonine dehydratase